MLPQSQSTSNLPDAEASTIPEQAEISSSTPELSQSQSRLPHRPLLQDYERSPSTSARSSSSAVPTARGDDPRQIIIRSFAPRIAIYASADAETLIKSKGFDGGLKGLLRPFGERIQGKVVIRDSVGASRGWEDFGVRLISFEHVQRSETPRSNGLPVNIGVDPQANDSRRVLDQSIFKHDHGRAASIDEVIERELKSRDGQSRNQQNGNHGFEDSIQKLPSADSSAYLLYLRKLLSSLPFVPYETFTHPVTCVIAVSSHSSEPIEVLRQLYDNTSRGDKSSPAWVGNDYLRYYVLIHDEEKDDIIKSTALFDLMKRHFGLNCHLLRLRSSVCIETDDDSVQVPQCEWLAAEEELARTRIRDRTNSVKTSEKYIFESDATGIRSFLREMVTQSVIPFMEGRIVTWNDQVASRRRGISGRFMSLSKRWTGFGTGKGTAATGGSSNPSGSSYDPVQGFYPPETSEATMRQLADYALMLRDWRLAHSTYDILRADFSNDKAWKYHAAANEMAAVSFLLIPQTISSRSRSDTVDQLLEAASYSYLTRCSIQYGVIRCITIAMELLRSRGSAAAQDAVRWGGKLLELGILSPFAQAFVAERMADCYNSRTGAGSLGLGSRKRQTAFWNLMSAEIWTRLGISSRTQRRLEEARISYGQNFHSRDYSVPFLSMQEFGNSLEQKIDIINRDPLTDSETMTFKFQGHSTIGDESHQLDLAEFPGRGVPKVKLLGILGNNAQPNDDGFE